MTFPLFRIVPNNIFRISRNLTKIHNFHPISIWDLETGLSWPVWVPYRPCPSISWRCCFGLLWRRLAYCWRRRYSSSDKSSAASFEDTCSRGRREVPRLAPPPDVSCPSLAWRCWWHPRWTWPTRLSFPLRVLSLELLWKYKCDISQNITEQYSLCRVACSVFNWSNRSATIDKYS